MYLKEEWHARRVVMEVALEVLSDGHYDKKTFTYRLRQIEAEGIDSALKSIGEKNTSEKIKSEVKAQYIGLNDVYMFLASSGTCPTFFNIPGKSRTIEVVLNRNHPLFATLDSLFESVENASCEKMR